MTGWGSTPDKTVDNELTKSKLGPDCLVEGILHIRRPLSKCDNVHTLSINKNKTVLFMCFVILSYTLPVKAPNIAQVFRFLPETKSRHSMYGIVILTPKTTSM